jgi:hypothetical protein
VSNRLPSAARRASAALVLSSLIVAFPARALAGPADHDDPLLHPRAEQDPRLDLREPGARLPSPLRAPLWFAIDASLRRQDGGPTAIGGMLFVGLPLERLAARPVRIAEPPAPPQPEPPKPAPPPKMPPPAAPQAPLRIPIAVTPDAARGAVEAALRKARLVDPDAHIDAMALRARQSAALPELRLRALRSVDQGQTLAPTEYDPTRLTATTGSSLWMEARATWRLDRLLFAEEEVALERARQRRAEARAKISAHVLKLLFGWQKALAQADNPAASPEENLAARLHVLEAEAELDLFTDGWFGRWKAKQPPAPPTG